MVEKMTSSPLSRQESEMDAELKLALDEACLEVGVTLSTTVYPSALFLIGDPNAVPAYKLARWLASTRKRTMRSRSSRFSLVWKTRAAASDCVKNLAGSLQSPEGKSHNISEHFIVSPQKSPTEVAQETTLQERLNNAAEIDINSTSFTWTTLVSVYNTEHTASWQNTEDDMPKLQEVTVNSGGVVYFALFKQSSEYETEARETAAVLKFTPSRLFTQSERLGYEFAKQLGVTIPQSRIIHNGTPEWRQIQMAAERCLAIAKGDKNDSRETTCMELVEALSLSRCLLLMGYINGSPLFENAQAFRTQYAAEKTAADLGRVLVLDLVLRNEDRLCCRQLGWRGNSANLLFTEKPLIAVEMCSTLQDAEFSDSSLSKDRKGKNKIPFSERRKAQSVSSLSILQTGGYFSYAAEDKETSNLGGFHIVAIDSGVPRRPPAGKRATDQQQYPKLVELLLNNSEFSADLLYEISGGNLGLPHSEVVSDKVMHTFPSSRSLDQVQIVSAFRRSFRAGIRDMYNLQMFLLKLYRRLDMLLRKFILVISKALPNEADACGVDNTELSNSPDQATSEQSPISHQQCHQDKLDGGENLEEQPSILNAGKPCDEQAPQSEVAKDGYSDRTFCQEGLHKKINKCTGHSPLSKRLTLKLKGVNKTAKVDVELNEELKRWNEILCTEGRVLCQAKGFVTGFLEGGSSHSVVDSYELKVRLEHVLERMSLISKGADTERPSCVLEHLHIGGALAAKSFHTLQHIGITHIICLCPSEIESLEDDFMKAFEYMNIQIQDREDMDISCVCNEACDFIENAARKGGKVLVHCFEGKSRSAAVVLAYLMMQKKQTLVDAWDYLKAVHRRAQPNDGFMRTLVNLDRQIHGQISLDWQQKKPLIQTCPICGKSAGINNCNLRNHLHRSHPGITSPSTADF